MTLDYVEFRKLVINKAKEEYGQPVSVDTIKESYDLYVKGKATVEDAVSHVLVDSAYWDMDFFDINGQG